MGTEPPPPCPAAAAIARRRTTRRFDTGRSVDDALLAGLLKSATLAPSAFNLQPWRFLVVRGESNRRTLRGCAFNRPEVTEAPVAVVVLGYLNADRTHLNVVVDRMTASGVVSPAGASEFRARAAAAMERVRDRAGWAAAGAMTAAATLMLAAESAGVASALIGPFDPRRVKDAFGVPDDHAVCALVSLGHAAEPAAFPGRLPLDEVCFEEHFGQPWTLGEGGAISPEGGATTEAGPARGGALR